MCIYIGVNANSNGCGFVFHFCQVVDDIQFLDRLGIKTKNVGVQRKVDLFIGFTNPGKNDVIFFETVFQGSFHFVPAYAIRPKPVRLYGIQYPGIKICLHCIMHMKAIF